MNRGASGDLIVLSIGAWNPVGAVPHSRMSDRASPADSAIQALETGPDRIVLVATITSRAPTDLFRDWVEPERLARWWPPEARVDAREGGAFEFVWPQMGWCLRGKFVEFDPGRRLRFSWTWDHEPAITKEVDVTFVPAGDAGTELRVQHGPYGDGVRDVELRKEHLDGWLHFLQRLVDSNAARSSSRS